MKGLELKISNCIINLLKVFSFSIEFVVLSVCAQICASENGNGYVSLTGDEVLQKKKNFCKVKVYLLLISSIKTKE